MSLDRAEGPANPLQKQVGGTRGGGLSRVGRAIPPTGSPDRAIMRRGLPRHCSTARQRPWPAEPAALRLCIDRILAPRPRGRNRPAAGRERDRHRRGHGGGHPGGGAQHRDAGRSGSAGAGGCDLPAGDRDQGFRPTAATPRKSLCRGRVRPSSRGRRQPCRQRHRPDPTTAAAFAQAARSRPSC